ncbi:MAG: N-acetyltransferase [Trueperaceae bacterium]|nr:N-acetyltransferase [Trueperaceae bacterium]
MSRASSSSEPEVKHNPAQQRFEIVLEEGTAVLVYMKVGDTLIFHHTEVPEALEGKGLASLLAKTGLDFVRENHITAGALCPFVKGYVEKHPEYQDLIKLRH